MARIAAFSSAFAYRAFAVGSTAGDAAIADDARTVVTLADTAITAVTLSDDLRTTVTVSDAASV